MLVFIERVSAMALLEGLSLRAIMKSRYGDAVPDVPLLP
jgi:hypothetical protein